MTALTPTIHDGAVYYAGDLSRDVDHLDHALYVASCFSRVPQIIYGTTDSRLVRAEGGERYLILDEGTPVPEWLGDLRDAFHRVYRVSQ